MVYDGVFDGGGEAKLILRGVLAAGVVLSGWKGGVSCFVKNLRTYFTISRILPFCSLGSLLPLVVNSRCGVAAITLKLGQLPLLGSGYK